MVLAAFLVCVLLPFWIIGYWTEDEYIEHSGWRFTASALLSLVVGFALEYGGIPIRSYLFGTHWYYGLFWCFVYLLIGGAWSRHRLGLFLPRIMGERDKVFKQFCESVRSAKSGVERMLSEERKSASESSANGESGGQGILSGVGDLSRRVKHGAERMLGARMSLEEIDSPDRMIEVAFFSGTARGEMKRSDFDLLMTDMEPFLDGKRFGLPRSMVPHWEAYYEERGARLVRTGLSATATEVAWGENKERIALWLFFWPSSVIRNIWTVLRDVLTALVDRLRPLYQGMFARHGKAFEVGAGAAPAKD